MVCIVLVSACSGGSQTGEANQGDRAEQSASQFDPPVGVRVVAAGDIACAPGEPVTNESCQQAATAALAQSLDPALVLTLGDTQYPESTLPQLMGSYDKSWGALLDRTRPTVGNHEYRTPGASGYYAYFKDRQPGPPGYYRLNVGGWKITVLNSNCTLVSCAEQAAWMDRKMKAYPAKCSIVTMHHPRYSSGSEHGNNTAVKPLWAVAYKHRNDIVLSVTTTTTSGSPGWTDLAVPLPTACSRSSSGPVERTSTSSAPGSRAPGTSSGASTVSWHSTCGRAPSGGSSTASTERFWTKGPVPACHRVDSIRWTIGSRGGGLSR